ncbi:MAG: beta-hydroxyacyl-ACP dehydratase [Bacteroidaceae bacterium]|nr:beta-hydroxyacyl-ACP dehydratase [Bacteroidaceae bacterium]
MKLQDNLFTILSQQETEGLATFQLRIHPEWPIYEAHFPGHPITPGVCIVQMVQELLGLALHRNVTLRKAKNVKYLAIISPDEVSDLTVSFTKIEEQPDGSLKVQAQVTGSETTYTKLSATFA